MMILIFASLLSLAWCATTPDSEQCMKSLATVRPMGCSWTNCKPSTTCLHGGTCVPNPNGDDTCVCPAGFRGKQCETGLCHPNPCLHSGICTVSGKDFTCDCRWVYKGKTCNKGHFRIVGTTPGASAGDLEDTGEHGTQWGTTRMQRVDDKFARFMCYGLGYKREGATVRLVDEFPKQWHGHGSALCATGNETRFSECGWVYTHESYKPVKLSCVS